MTLLKCMEMLEAHTMNAWNDLADKFNQWDQLDSEAIFNGTNCHGR